MLLARDFKGVECWLNFATECTQNSDTKIFTKCTHNNDTKICYRVQSK